MFKKLIFFILLTTCFSQNNIYSGFFVQQGVINQKNENRDSNLEYLRNLEIYNRKYITNKTISNYLTALKRNDNNINYTEAICDAIRGIQEPIKSNLREDDSTQNLAFRLLKKLVKKENKDPEKFAAYYSEYCIKFQPRLIVVGDNGFNQFFLSTLREFYYATFTQLKPNFDENIIIAIDHDHKLKKLDIINPQLEEELVLAYLGILDENTIIRFISLYIFFLYIKHDYLRELDQNKFIHSSEKSIGAINKIINILTDKKSDTYKNNISENRDFLFRNINWIKTIKFKSYIIEDFGAIKGDAKLFDQIANAFKALKKNKEFDYKSTFKIALSGIYNNNSNIQKNSLQLLLKLIKNKKNKKFDNPELSVNFFNIIYFEDTNKQTLLLYFKGVYSSSTKTIRLNKKYENSDSDNSSDESSDNSSETYPSDSSSIEF